MYFTVYCDSFEFLREKHYFCLKIPIRCEYEDFRNTDKRTQEGP